MKTALVFGSTGLVGGHLLDQLIKNENYNKIKLFVRSEIIINDLKVEIVKTDFNNIENVGQLLFIYTIFSSYAFLVNFYLGIRFLKNKNNTKSPLNAIIDYSKKYAYYTSKTNDIK